jgi:hypothetical protein
VTRTRERNDVQVLLPEPVVSWEDVLRVADPGRLPTRGRVRTLRANGRLSAGVHVHRHSFHGVSGSSTYFSSLWGWAQRCRLEGRDGDSSKLEDAARRVEEQFAHQLKEFLSLHTLEELRDADFYNGLSSVTADELCKVPGLTDLVLAAGRVTEVGSSTVRVTGRNPSNEDAEVDLPTGLFSRRGLSGGEGVWVLSRMVGDAALVEVLPAVTTNLTLTKAARNRWAHGKDWLEAAPAHGYVTGVSDQMAARNYLESAGAIPSDDYLAELLGDVKAGKAPIRRLRPVG